MTCRFTLTVNHTHVCDVNKTLNAASATWGYRCKRCVRNKSFTLVSSLTSDIDISNFSMAHNYSLYAKMIFKRDDKYSFEMHRQSGWVGFRDKVVGNSPLYYECIIYDCLLMKKSSTKSIKTFKMNCASIGRVEIQEQSDPTLVNGEFVNQEGIT